MRIPIKMTEPLTKPCRVANPCQGICSTSTVGSIFCVGCHRHYKDIIRWNTYTQSQKIEAMWRANQHRKLKAEGKVTDNEDYKHELEGFNIND